MGFFFSPVGKPFTFGHPSIESIAKCFLNENIPVIDYTHALIEAHRMESIKKSELCTLCGNEIFFIIFSFAGKPFAYGHPCIESIANFFLNGNIRVIDNTHAFIEVHRMILIVGGKLLSINLTQGSSTNDTPISRSFSTCSTSLGAGRLQQLLQCLLQRVLLKMSLLIFLQVMAMESPLQTFNQLFQGAHLALSTMANTGKKTRGKKKIEIKMIENDDDRLITFSKHRLGIYKKIGELSTLCGKPFTFGHPSIESIANHFLNGNIPVIDNTHALIEAHCMVRINKVIQLYNQMQSQMDASNETRKVLAQQITSGTNSNRWWETPLDQLNPRELYEQFSYFSKLLDLFHISQSKKIATASSMLARTGPTEDAPTNFPLVEYIQKKKEDNFELKSLSSNWVKFKIKRGRQKVEIKMIENEDDRLITFSKRKPFTFSHPSIKSIANRFLNGNIPVIDNTHALIEAHRMSQVDASTETQKVLAQPITSGTNSNLHM
ncbi:hypothetical protein CXB51_010655 [Gossypium anomalum]|uniref:MADS-box domain-containing protein n=1 Tax=Gossypium anomalum TaxID=47600 RepID=A0A8J5YMX4_9ROSI|nr:hypothetical protein CXB51_010655 [Gossypium anomalum]